MKFIQLVPLLLALALCLAGGVVHAKADTVALYTEAVMTGDVPALEKLLAPNYWHVSSNGHIQDKENFIASIKNKELVVDRLTLANTRETKVGDTRLLTANGHFKGTATPALPQGLMRFTMVIASNNGHEQVALFQATPVEPSADCQDGNCKIR
ncbi:nuclear transport factor 2 family protein [uncultured Desulfovibrio sp.]|uniref:nuclear transport factor 2 family protein n=1 Tax=uncultured Desulfovibrio sp. TaxID=167968 RepID=UPI0026304F4B|nr:nuclear transport factor 2 family protein [uncultured Desulfovibrio sp.]